MRVLYFVMIADDSQNTHGNFLSLISFVDHDSHSDASWSMHKTNGSTNTGMTESRVIICRIAVGANQLIPHTHFGMAHIVRASIVRQPCDALEACNRSRCGQRSTTRRHLVEEFFVQQLSGG